MLKCGGGQVWRDRVGMCMRMSCVRCEFVCWIGLSRERYLIGGLNKVLYPRLNRRDIASDEHK